jgi:hypothetical protein
MENLLKTWMFYDRACMAAGECFLGHVCTVFFALHRFTERIFAPGSGEAQEKESAPTSPKRAV